MALTLGVGNESNYSGSALDFLAQQEEESVGCPPLLLDPLGDSTLAPDAPETPETAGAHLRLPE